MDNIGKRLKRLFSLSSRGIHRKLLAAFALMALIPLVILISLFLRSFMPDIAHLAWLENLKSASIVIMTTLVISFLGLLLLIDIIRPIIKITKQAKNIAGGNFTERVEVTGEDEIGQLGQSLNHMTHHLYENMEKLKSYEEEIREINIAINKKVLALSSLFQVGNIITTSSSLEPILKLIVEQVSQNTNSDRVFLVLADEKEKDLLRVHTCHNLPTLAGKEFKKGEGPLGKLAKEARILIADKNQPPSQEIKAFLDEHRLSNFLVLPIIARGRLIGLLGTGNQIADFAWGKDEIDLANIFARQIAVAIENSSLLQKTRELAVIDEVSGLYNTNYIQGRLKEEIQRAIAYQRPCSLVFLKVDDFKKYQERQDETVVATTIKRVATILEENIQEIDRAGHVGEAEFVLILPENNKGEAKRLAEKLRREVEETTFPYGQTQPLGKVTVSCGVSANPIDGLKYEELWKKAYSSLGQAINQGKNRVI